uniref:PAT complex subunit Asterix n=1 Tax=Callorhinchus milii TaxID=7868 RepID=A0A4W3GXN5_CALMI
TEDCHIIIIIIIIILAFDTAPHHVFETSPSASRETRPPRVAVCLGVGAVLLRSPARLSVVQSAGLSRARGRGSSPARPGPAEGLGKCPRLLCFSSRYKPPSSDNNPTLEDPTPDYMNLLGMIFSMCGLMLKLKWCAWIAVYCSFISFANSRSSEDTKQMMSSFMLSISAVVMSYLQNPQPMSPPW